MALSVLDRPIPGQSLTDEPKNYPWERPPEISDPDEALSFYINKLENPDTLDGVMELLEDTRITLTGLVSGLTRLNTSRGVHGIDVGLIISPAIHEYIKRVADIVGIEYEEGLPKKGTDEETERKKSSIKALGMLADAGIELPSASAKVDTIPEGEVPEKDMEVKEVMAEEEPMGLMARRTT
tara:strand:- start:100 stop:645 length:546 start_codon:yes stop_codon:yes gene_type:complete